MAAEGYDPVTRPWQVAADGVGLRVWAYSQSVEANAPVKFALTGIAVEHRYPAVPARSVLPPA